MMAVCCFFIVVNCVTSGFMEAITLSVSYFYISFQRFIKTLFSWKLGFMLMSLFSIKLTKYPGLNGEVGVYSHLAVDVFCVH